jgi:predicted DNA-binding ribbon-helix-helix protein
LKGGESTPVIASEAKQSSLAPLDCRVAALLAMTYSVARKRSVTIAGHETSVSLEPLFWDALETAASEEALPLNALIARIDVERLDAVGGGPNLTSALRQWLFARARRERQ